MGEERVLAAVMQTDIVEYTRLVERDERLALQLLGEHNELLRDLFNQHAGREVKSMGDGFLVEFSSALQAAKCAIAAQRALAERNALAPPSERIRVRIGLHLGDVVRRDGDLFGDGVNAVSRIEPLCEPGGVCLSSQVYDQVWNKIDLPLDSLGEQNLKNVRQPIELFRIVLPWMDGAPESGVSAKSSDSSSVLDRIGIDKEVLAAPEYGLLIERMLLSLVRLHHRNAQLDPSMRELIKAWIRNTADFLEGVDLNQFHVKIEDIRDYAIRFLQLIEEGDEVHSFNYIFTPVWWDTSLGTNYMLHKINASRRGADIHQVIIEPDADSMRANKALISKLVGPHASKGSFRIYGVAEAELVRELRLDLFLVKGRLAFKNDLEGRTWLRGFEIFFAPSAGLARLERACEEIMTHEALVEYDPHGLYGGEEDFDSFVDKVFKRFSD